MQTQFGGVTVLPSTAHLRPYFPEYAFHRKTRAVSQETRIAWADYGRMHIGGKSQRNGKRDASPAWAFDDTVLRELITLFCERRVFLRWGASYAAPPGTSHVERLRFAQAKEMERLAIKRQWLDRMIDEHHRATHNGESAKRIADLEREIQNLDSDLVLTQRGIPTVVVGIVYYYFRLGMNSVEVAEQLQLRPPHVRIIVYRLKLLHKKLVAGQLVKQRKHREAKPRGVKMFRRGTTVRYETVFRRRRAQTQCDRQSRLTLAAA
ncbi:MAG: hypothetical protein ACRD4X_01925 [Candidatus Acidiferrales bacterium]